MRLRPVGYAKHAVFVWMSGYFPKKAAARALRKTLVIWADYDSYTLPEPITMDLLKAFALAFRRQLGARGWTRHSDLSDADANAAALAAVKEMREAWRLYERLRGDR
jgi:hypothetical protein